MFESKGGSATEGALEETLNRSLVRCCALAPEAGAKWSRPGRSVIALSYGLRTGWNWDSVAQQRGFDIGFEEARRVVIDNQFVQRGRELHAREAVRRVHVGNRGEIVVGQGAGEIVMQSYFGHGREN